MKQTNADFNNSDYSENSSKIADQATSKAVNTNQTSFADKVNNHRETFVYIFILAILFFALLVILVPNPLRSKNNAQKNGNYMQEIKKDYSLPEVCKLIDPASAQLIIQDKIVPYTESIPSTSTIVCTYSNTSRNKGISLIAKRYNDNETALTSLEETNSDKYTKEDVEGKNVIFDEENYQVKFVDGGIVYNLQYIGFEDLDLIKLKKDISLVISKL